MYERFREATAVRGVLLALLLANLAGLAAVAQLVDAATAVKGAYTTAGLVAALVVVETGRHRGDAGLALPDVPPRWALKVVVLVAALSVVVLRLGGPSRLVLAVLVPLGYVALFYQYLRADEVGGSMLGQLGLLFATLGAVRYETTHFYFGNGDLVSHSAWTRDLVATGAADHLPTGYETFPGLHVASGVLSSIAGFGANDAILVLGVCSFGVLLATVFLFFDRYTGQSSTAFLAVVFLSVSSTFVYYSTYFFPQSLAIALLFAVFYLATTAGATVRREEYLVWLSVVGAALLTHHFTFVVTLPIVVVLLGYDLASRLASSPPDVGEAGLGTWLRGTSVPGSDASAARVHSVLLSAPYLLAGAKWTLFDREFLSGFVELAGQVLAETLSGGTTGADATVTVYLGTSPPDPLAAAVRSLASVDGVHQAAVFAAIVVGALAVLFADRGDPTVRTLAVIGAGGSLFLLALPVEVFTGQRLALPFAAFVFFLAALGVEWVLDRARGAQVLPVVALVALLAATGPLVAMADVGDHAREPQPRGEYGESEFRQLSAAAEFVRRNDAERVTSFNVDRSVYAYYEHSRPEPNLARTEHSPSDSLEVTEGTLRAPDAILYNENWADHRLRHDASDESLVGRHALVSEAWLAEYTAAHDTTYDAGEVGIVAS